MPQTDHYKVIAGGHVRELAMRLDEVRTFEDLEGYLRNFTNVLGDPTPYDFNGALELFLALLDNLARHHADADIESVEGFPPVLSEDQRHFLKKLTRRRGMEHFLSMLGRSGLVSETKLESLLLQFRESTTVTEPDAVASFAAFLVQTGELTCWQCAKLREGKYKGFFCDDFKLIDSMGSGPDLSYYLAEAVTSRQRVVLAFRPGTSGADYTILKEF